MNGTFVKYTRCYVWRKQVWIPTLKPHPTKHGESIMVWSSFPALRPGWHTYEQKNVRMSEYNMKIQNQFL